MSRPSQVHNAALRSKDLGSLIACMRCVVVFAAAAMGLVAVETWGQDRLAADPQGWAANTLATHASADLSNHDFKFRANQPTTLDTIPVTDEPMRSVNPVASIAELDWENPSSEVRNQIGLASFELDESNEPPAEQEPSDSSSSEPLEFPFGQFFSRGTDSLTAPSGIHSTLKFALLLGALSLAPAIILMTTSYIRVIVVLSLLKQAFGGQQLPPAQVLTALSLFISFLIMSPVWNQLKTTAIDPYSANEIGWEEAWNRGVTPIRNFMVRQIELAGNEESVAVFYRYAHESSAPFPNDLSEVPINVLIPAFMISELKVAFLLGFQVFLPFLVLDLVVSSVTVSMGMVMLPPQMVSFPLKLILFVLVDGWNLVIGMLLQSFG